MNEPFHILSLSGGGYLGLYTAAVLSDLEEQSGIPLGRRFDLLTGTSIGGVLALGLAAEVPVAKIVASFECNGVRIFSNRPAPKTSLGSWIDVLRSFLRPKYSSDALRQTIEDLVGPQTRIGDLCHRVMVPAVNLTTGLPQVFKTSHHETFSRDLRLKVVDVALAATAAPTYFPVAEIGNELFADGGLYANSPDMLALHEAEFFLGQERKHIALLSVGTTTSQFSFSHATGCNLGSLSWAREQRLVNVIIASQQNSTSYMLEHSLADRYVRLDVTQSKEQERHLALDVATRDAQKTLKGLASATMQTASGRGLLTRFLTHTGREPVFYNRG